MNNKLGDPIGQPDTSDLITITHRLCEIQSLGDFDIHRGAYQDGPCRHLLSQVTPIAC